MARSLKPGVSTLSYGTQCASMNGIPEPIIERANILAKLARQGEDLVALCSGLSSQEIEDFECAEATARAFLEWEINLGEEIGSDEKKAKILDKLDELLGLAQCETHRSLECRCGCPI